MLYLCYMFHFICFILILYCIFISCSSALLWGLDPNVKVKILRAAVLNKLTKFKSFRIKVCDCDQVDSSLYAAFLRLLLFVRWNQVNSSPPCDVITASLRLLWRRRLVALIRLKNQSRRHLSWRTQGGRQETRLSHLFYIFIYISAAQTRRSGSAGSIPTIWLRFVCLWLNSSVSSPRCRSLIKNV